MKTKIYAIKDVKSGFNQSLMIFPNHEVAIRWFKSVSQDETSLLCKCKEDFELWFVGEFDYQHGTISGEPDFIFSMVGA